ncbi:MAG: 2-hydroxyacyl-CoA dehydratase family protein [Candidatus Thermoplasmatota archaeon]|nr:2-hydroxyacyl-CoA dehydratase family protein [Candidatus Thermoplasmatota archaeon]
MAQEKLLRKKIHAAEELKKLMANYYYELASASKTGNKKIAWCTSVGPAELLRSLGFLVYFPENHGAMLGATRTATDCIITANAFGYSPEICSYLTSDIGAWLRKETPLLKAYGIERVPKPDVLVFNTNQCRDVQDWFSFYAHEFKVPLLGINTHRGVGNVEAVHINSVAEQFEALIEPLEKISGNKFSLGELKRVLALSLETSKLWRKVLETATVRPSPLTFFDGTIHMAPAVVLRGTELANDYYKLLLEELEKRIQNNIAAVDNEKFRLYWEGMPIWGKLRELSELFQTLNTCVVASTYCNSWIFDSFDPSKPFYSMAKAYTELFIVRSDEVKEKYIEEMIKTFKIDGIIFHDAKTCPNNSNSRYCMPKRLQERTKKPSLIINADLNDLRCYSEEQTKTNITAFIEQLAG